MPERIVQYIVNPFIYLLIGIAVLVFLWGIVEFIANADKPEARLEGQRHLIWGMIGLMIIFGVFGIMNLLQDTLLEISG